MLSFGLEGGIKCSSDKFLEIALIDLHRNPKWILGKSQKKQFLKMFYFFINRGNLTLYFIPKCVLRIFFITLHWVRLWKMWICRKKKQLFFLGVEGLLPHMGGGRERCPGLLLITFYRNDWQRHSAGLQQRPLVEKKPFCLKLQLCHHQKMSHQDNPEVLDESSTEQHFLVDIHV